MPRPNKGIMKEALATMLRDLKVIYTDTWFLPRESFESSVNAWHKALGGFTYDQLRAAFDAYVSGHDKPPVPSQIRELVYAKTETTSKPFDADEYWSSHNYWVLTDQDGCLVNEIIAETSDTADDIAAYFTKLGYDLSGTVLKTAEFGKYKPKYKATTETKPSDEDIRRMFAHYDPIVTASPTIETPEKQMAFERRRQELLEQATMFTKENNK